MVRKTLTTGAPPSQVLEALRRRGGEWRSSALPAELHQAGITSVDCRVESPRFRLWYTWGWALRSPQLMRKIAPAIGLRLRGTVAADSTGGSTVTLALGYRPPWSATWPILVASGLALFSLARSVTNWPFAAAIAAGVAFIWWRCWIADRALGRRSDSLAAYLLERVESVITDVELNTPQAAAGRSGGPQASRSAN